MLERDAGDVAGIGGSSDIAFIVQTGNRIKLLTEERRRGFFCRKKDCKL